MKHTMGHFNVSLIHRGVLISGGVFCTINHTMGHFKVFLIHRGVLISGVDFVL